MLEIELIKEKLDLISRDLEHLQAFSEFTFDQVAHDFVRYAAVKNILMEIIGRGIDINHHLISELAPLEMGTPKTYRETFLFLGRLNILPPDFAEIIAESAGFRNAIVHEYNNLDQGIVYRTVGEAVRQYEQYCRAIWGFLKTVP